MNIHRYLITGTTIVGVWGTGCAGGRNVSRPSRSVAFAPIVFVIGAIHGSHLETSSHYSLNDLGAQIAYTKPDLICGEISSEHYRTPLEGLYPPEAVFVEDVAARIGATFHASDWRGDFEAARAAEAAMSPEASQRYAHEQSQVQLLMRSFRGESVFDLVHSIEMQAALRRAHNVRIEVAVRCSRPRG